MSISHVSITLVRTKHETLHLSKSKIFQTCSSIFTTVYFSVKADHQQGFYKRFILIVAFSEDKRYFYFVDLEFRKKLFGFDMQRSNASTVP